MRNKLTLFYLFIYLFIYNQLRVFEIGQSAVGLNIMCWC